MTDKMEEIKKEGIAGEDTAGEEVDERAAKADEIKEEERKEDRKEDKKEEKKEEKEEEKKEDKEQEEGGDAGYLRLMADFQNYRKRVEKEKSELYSYANEKIVGELLEVIDNFERALHQTADEAGHTGEGFKEGMEMIFKQLVNVLEKSGLAEIPALGEDFDPNVHDAVMTEETENYESGKVSCVIQKGYKLNGKVIRPSMVKVVS